MKHKSISQRLRSTQSIKIQREIITDWQNGWEIEQQVIIKRLEQAIKHLDYDELCKATGELKVITEKRFKGLRSVTNILLPEKEKSHH